MAKNMGRYRKACPLGILANAEPVCGKKKNNARGNIFPLNWNLVYFKNEPISSCDEHMLKPKVAQFSQTI